jgi:hypothetical protein
MKTVCISSCFKYLYKMSVFNLFRSEDYTMLTPLSAEEVHKRLAANTEPEQLLRFNIFRSRSARAFEGIVAAGYFKIKRIINYRNSFLPVIEGSIGSFMGKTEISIKMRLMYFVKVFMIVWFGIFFTGAGVFMYVYFKTNDGFNQTGTPLLALAPLLLFFIIVFIARLAFRHEAKKAKQFLAQLLEAEEHLLS